MGPGTGYAVHLEEGERDVIKVVHCHHCKNPFDVGDDIYKVEESHGVLVSVCIRCLSGIRDFEVSRRTDMRKKNHTHLQFIEPKPETRVLWQWVLRQIRINFTPGDEFSLSGLADDLGVSKTTVRKAIKRASREDRKVWGINWVDDARPGELILEGAGGKMHLLVAGSVEPIEIE